ncbi:MAG: hypothetical protein JNL38_16030 [Myxococcales bacterium]|jgi:hypothetical protein|nr:hypothetical protein [Myxococcales bacterium]
MLFDNLYPMLTTPGTAGLLLLIVSLAATIVVAGKAATRTPRAAHRPLV